MAVIQLIGQVQNPFANISGYLPKFYACLASAERLMEAEVEKSALTETDKETEKYGRVGKENGYDWMGRHSAAEIQSLYRTHFRAVGFCGISFTYLPPDS